MKRVVNVTLMDDEGKISVGIAGKRFRVELPSDVSFIPIENAPAVIELLTAAYDEYADAIKCQACGLLTVDPETERCVMFDADHSATDDPAKEG